MNVYDEYKAKCCSADEAVKIVKDGDWVDYSMSCAYPTALDKALGRRHAELKDIKVRNAISCHPVAILEADPENKTFTYNLVALFRRRSAVSRCRSGLPRTDAVPRLRFLLPSRLCPGQRGHDYRIAHG